MKKRTILWTALAVLLAVAFVSCTTPPPPKVNQEGQRAQDIVQGTSTPDQPATTPGSGSSAKDIVTQSGQQQGTTTPSPDQPAAPAGNTLTPEEAAYLRNYLSRLSYMVYYDEAGMQNREIAKMAVSQADRYLIEKKGLSVIDFDQIEKNKKDQQAAYQAETGGSISMMQYLAQKFNADVYVEISIAVSAEMRSGGYYGSAQGSMKMFDSSTATLLGSIAFVSPPTYSPTSAESAISNAVQASIWTAMPRMTEQAQTLIGASMSRGVRYELVVQKTQDAKLINQFERALGKKFREVEKLSFSPEETKFNIYSFMDRGKVESAVYDAAATVGLNDLYLVYMRGKSFTFNTGL
jgi:hypothetical protein